MGRNSHILNAASNLLGIALVIIAGIHVAGKAEKLWSDEIAWLAAALLSTSCFLAYLSIRKEPVVASLEDLADKLFILGMLALLGAVGFLAFLSN